MQAAAAALDERTQLLRMHRFGDVVVETRLDGDQPVALLAPARDRDQGGPLPGGLILTNGLWQLLDSDRANYPRKFYRLIEQ